MSFKKFIGLIVLKKVTSNKKKVAPKNGYDFEKKEVQDNKNNIKGEKVIFINTVNIYKINNNNNFKTHGFFVLPSTLKKIRIRTILK